MKKNGQSSTGPTVRVRTLGCKVNFCDGNALLEALLEAGFAKPALRQPADLEIINTCAVTSRSVQKARTLIRRVRNANPSSQIVVTGCAARLQEQAFQAIPEVSELCLWPSDVVLWAQRRYSVTPRAAVKGAWASERTRAFIKIQDGCEAFCSYCIVPTVRGKCRSIDPASAIGLVRGAADGGFPEIVLCGIHLGQYGRDIGDVSLAGLLRGIGSLPGRFRVRLSSIEPLEVTPDLLDAMYNGDRFCPHLHLPLQSGSDRVLGAMRRPYTSEQYFQTVAAARSVLNNPAITTDIMAGFPGETEEDHMRTLDAMRKVGFARVHCFPFSPRRGTSAFGMSAPVSPGDSKRRSRQVRSAAAETALVFRRGLVGANVEVIVESAFGGRADGICARYQRVRFAGSRELIGKVVRLCIMSDGGREGILEGRLVQ